MKILQLLPLLPVLCLLPVQAQTMTNEPVSSGVTPPPQPPVVRGPMAALSESERQQVKAAHDKAIQQDPSLEQKMKAARQAMDRARKEMHEAMIKADPAVEPILEKMMPPKWGENHAPPGKSPVGQGTNPAAGPWQHEARRGKGMVNLSESERQRVMALHQQVQSDLSVMAAHEELKGGRDT